jgi:hypothetical protein
MADNDRDLSDQEYNLLNAEADLLAQRAALDKREQALLSGRGTITDAQAEQLELERSKINNQIKSVVAERTEVEQKLDAAYPAVKPNSAWSDANNDDDDDDDDDADFYGNRDNASSANNNAKVQALTNKKISTQETSTTTTTGGGVTTVGYNEAELDAYIDKRSAAQQADRAEQKRVNDAYLQSQGLADAPAGERLRAISKAKRDGAIPEVSTATDEFEANNSKPVAVTTREEGEAVAQEKVTNNETANSNTAAGSLQPTNSESGTAIKTDEDEDDNPGEELDDEELAELEEGIDRNENSNSGNTGDPVVETDKAGVVVATESDTEGKGDQAGDEITEADKAIAADEVPVPVIDTKVVYQFPKATSSPQVTLPNEVTEFTSSANILHNYASYTYRITLYMLSVHDYKVISDTPHLWKPSNAIVSGAGKHDLVSAHRHPEFKDDFYFQELSIQTMVGLNAKSKASNALDLNFSLIEPYGITFLDRLVAASRYFGSKNYLDMPYLLQIEFYGQTDSGVADFQPIPNTTKRIPIRLLGMDIDVTSQGATYKISASPYNHTAFDEKIAVTSVNLQVTAGDVGGFFRSKDSSEMDKTLANRARATNALKALAKINPEEAREAKEKYAKQLKAPIRIETYPAGLNSWFNYMVTENARVHADKILFNIHPDIAISKIVRPSKNAHTTTKMAQAGTKEGAALSRNNGAGPDFNEKGFIINAGTSILKVIDMVIRNSEYISNQIKDPATSVDAQKMSPEEFAKALNKPFKWYKVIPSVELGEFDEKANRYSKIITYHVLPHEVADTKHPYGPRKKPTRFHKAYSYFYTGANHDIIDFKIEFNALYYNVVSINRANSQTSTVSPGKTEQRNSKIVNPSGGKNAVFGQHYEFTAGDQSGQGLDMDSSSTTKTVNDIQHNLYQNSKADMLSLTMQIIGDPDYIKQDDVYINPRQKDYEDKTSGDKINGGSLVYDKGEVYALVRFKSPTDIDETTGLIRTDGRYVDTAFTGLYRVMGVKNTFRQGTFKQDIDLIRILDHDVNLALGNTVPTERQVKASIKRNLPIIPASQAGVNLGKQPDITSATLPQLDKFGNDVAGAVTQGVEEITNAANASNGLMSRVGGAMAALNGVNQITAALSGGGLGSLPGIVDGVGQLGSGLNSLTNGLAGVSNALPGSVNELTGGVGAGFPSLDAFGGAGDIVQSGASTLKQFAMGTGITGANPDLTAIAALGDEIDIAGLQSELREPISEVAAPPVILGGFAPVSSSLLTAAAKAKQTVSQLADKAGITLPSMPDIQNVSTVLNDAINAAGFDVASLDGAVSNGVNLGALRDIGANATSLDSKMSGFVNGALNDPNAPPYTGDDPIVRARLGLPPIPTDFT